MVDAVHKKMKKAAVTEEDVCTLLQRYSASTVLSLLREVAQFSGVKIDWQSLVEKSKTGIKTAREYQMLWRHLAYRQPLIENVAADDQLLDDDSDLECELEACPPVSTEDAVEASNCVKMLASGSANESGMPNSSSVEAGVHGSSSNVCSENLLVQKQSQTAGTCGEAFDANGLSNNRKRRKWSEEEDQELITAVQKFGEGSWAAIIKGEFKGNRNATQLAQRWNIIRKKQGTLNIGGAKVAGPQLTEAQLATRRALDVALSTGCGTVTNGTAGTTSAKTSTSKKDLPVTKATAPVSQPQSPPVTTSVKPTPVTSIEKVRSQKKAAAQSSINTTDSIQAAAVAAGARIGSPSDAASLLKAVQSKNTVHIRGGGSLVKTSAAGSSNPLPSNVHFVRTGLAATPTSSASGLTSFGVGTQAKGNVICSPAPSAAVSSFPKVGVTPAAQQIESRALTAVNVEGSDELSTQVHEDDASLGECSLKAVIHKPETCFGADVGPTGQTPDVGNSQCAMDNDVSENEHKDDACEQVTENQVSKINKSLDLQSCTLGVNGTSEVPPTAVDGNLEMMEVTTEGLAET